MKYICKACGNRFKPNSAPQKFCNSQCWGEYQKQPDKHTFFTTLLRKERKDAGLTHEILISMWQDQKGLCALSGVPMTMIRKKGRVNTNCSIDRIRPGEAYTPDNIRLVCSFINGFRQDVSDSELEWWCDQVVKNGSHRK